MKALAVMLLAFVSAQILAETGFRNIPHAVDGMLKGRNKDTREPGSVFKENIEDPAFKDAVRALVPEERKVLRQQFETLIADPSSAVWDAEPMKSFLAKYRMKVKTKSGAPAFPPFKAVTEEGGVPMVGAFITHPKGYPTLASLSRQTLLNFIEKNKKTEPQLMDEITKIFNENWNQKFTNIEEFLTWAGEEKNLKKDLQILGTESTARKVIELENADLLERISPTVKEEAP